MGRPLAPSHDGFDCSLGGCPPPKLHEWGKKAEVDSGKRATVPTARADRLKALERENREFRQANDMQREALTYFAQDERARDTWHSFRK